MSQWARVALALIVVPLSAQTIPPPDDSRNSMLREAALGLLTTAASAPEIQTKQKCLELPVRPANDRLEGPHGDTLISTRCEVISYERAPEKWSVARYRWTSLFTPEDARHGSSDTIIEEEVVIFDTSQNGTVRPVWHERFETGNFAAWRSVTPEIAPTAQGATLLSVMTCLNGTGGCGQEFLARLSDGRWVPVRQNWLDQLPSGYPERIRHGVQINPGTLEGEAGFYGDRDPNCCPSERLVFKLALRDDSLVLVRHSVLAERQQ